MSQPDRLSEALLGLCLLASQTTREGQERLVEQFRATYPEIRLVENPVLTRLWNLHKKLCKESCAARPKLHDDPCAWFRDDLQTLGEKP